MRILFGLVACLVLSLPGAHSAFAAWVYDANSEFKAFELANNGGSFAPSFSNFTAGYGENLGDFTAFAASQHTDNFLVGLQGWNFDHLYQVPAIAVNASDSPTPPLFSISPIAPSQIYMHPGGITVDGGNPPINNAVLRFTASNAGKYSVTGAWQSLDSGIPSNSGSTINYILRNGIAISTDTSDANFNFNLSNISLAPGDTIDFVVNAIGNPFYDSTGLTAVITGVAVPEPTTFALFGLGGIGLAGIAKRRRARKVA